MKKSLVALAVLAASGAAMAQSNVTLYGLVDLYYASVNNKVGGASLTQNVLDAGSFNGNSWGLRGSEDLGGGLNAIFHLVSGFSADTGASAQGGLLFGRAAYVGFTGGFGEVTVGRRATPYGYVAGAADGAFDSGFAPSWYVMRSMGYTYRADNSVYYQSPSMSGFSAAFQYALGENKTATLSAASLTALNVQYAGGPLGVQFGYQSEKPQGSGASVNFTRLGATYAFGPATVMGMYGHTENIGNVNNADATDWALGLDYVVSSALTLSASYAASDDNATAGDAERKGWGLGAKYALSKRTFFYGGYESDKTTKTATPDVKHSVFQLGVQHRF